MGDITIYLIDTDVLVAIRNKRDSQKIYEHLLKMAADGDLKTVRQVFGELEGHGSFFDFLHDKKSALALSVEKQYCVGVSQRMDIIGNKAKFLYEETGR